MMNWNDISIRKWLQIQEVSESDYSTVTKDIKILSIILDIPEDTIRQWQLKRLNEETAKLYFLSQPLPSRLEPIIELKGVKYGMIPQLDYITAGEWNDLENLRKEPIKNLPYYVAILYRPVTLYRESDGYYEIEEYSTKGFNERLSIFTELMPCTIAYTLLLFFSSFVIDLGENLATYLTMSNQEMKEKKTSKKKMTMKKKPIHTKPRKSIQKSS